MNKGKKLKEKIADKCSSLLVTSSSDSPDMNLEYFSGIDALTTSGIFFWNFDTEPVLFVSDTEQPNDVKRVQEKKTRKELYKQIKEEGGTRKIGVNGSHLSMNQKKKLEKELNAELVDVSDELQEQRAVKDEEEINNIKKACDVTRKALEKAEKGVKQGKKENEVFIDLHELYYSEPVKLSFTPIVASGKNSVYIHVFPENKEIKKTDTVIVDTGCRVNNYCSDLTKTFCLEPSSEQEKIINLTERAVEKAVNEVRPGMTGAEAYEVVEQFFEEEGVLENWKYPLGHGVGLNIHEGPSLSSESEDVLKPGMVFTLEPGLSVPGVGGTRIEFTGVLRENGFEKL